MANDRGSAYEPNESRAASSSETGAATDERDEPITDGTIYGKVTDRKGRPAKGLRLKALPLDVSISSALPSTRTNNVGEYRFENLSWWGKYSVYADDEDAGFSMFTSGLRGNSHPSTVELSPEHAEREFAVHLPSKGGFLHIQLTNQRTAVTIPLLKVEVIASDPQLSSFSITSHSDQVLLLPSEKDLILHVSAPGFHEWNQSFGKGKLIRLAAGAELTLAVPLMPMDR